MKGVKGKLDGVGYYRYRQHDIIVIDNMILSLSYLIPTTLAKRLHFVIIPEYMTTIEEMVNFYNIYYGKTTLCNRTLYVGCILGKVREAYGLPEEKV